jgi:PAS domain-containing protein
MTMRLRRPSRWAAAAYAVLVALLVIDLATGPDVFVIALYGIAPLVASFGSGWRTTAIVAVAALAVAEISSTTFDEMNSTNGAVFVFTVGLLGCGAAVMRTRREASAARAGLLAEELARRCSVALDNAQLVEEARAAERELHEAYGLLDAIFERAPVGLAVHDHDLRYVRINDRMAEINGLPAEAHIGRTVAEVVPEVAAIEADLRRVLESGEPLTELEVAGTTAAAPGV